MAFGENGDMRVLGVSRRARKLRHMINSWFKGENLDGGSKHISNSILQDALGLQESTRTMPHVNGKDKLNSFYKRELMKEGVISDELEGSRRFACSNRLQQEKLCSTRSWRSCSEELRSVIRESLLLNSYDDEKASSSRSLGSYSRGVINCSHYEEEMTWKNSVTVPARPVKMKAPNLIARLMGLEEVPAEAAEPIKMRQNRENINAPRSMFRDMLLGKISTEREKYEQLKDRVHEEDCRNQSGYTDTSVDEQHSRSFHMDVEAPSFATAMQLSSWRIGEAQEDLNSTNNSSQDSSQLKLAHESERKEVRILKKTKMESSRKSRMPASVCHEQQKNEAAKSLKRTDGGRKPGLNRIQLQSRREVKTAAAPPCQAKKTSTTSSESQATAKSIVFTTGGAPHHNNMISQRKLLSRNSTTPATAKRNNGVKPAQKTAKLKTTKQKEGEEINSSCSTEDASVINILPAAAEPPEQKKLLPKSSNKDKTSIYEFIKEPILISSPCNLMIEVMTEPLSLTEQTRKNQKVICETMPKTSRGKATEAVVELVDNELNPAKKADEAGYLEGIFLSCQPFLLQAYEQSLDGVSHNRKKYFHEVDKDAELYLACAEELMARRRRHEELSSCSWRSPELATIDQLVGEIRKGIRELVKCSEVDDGAASKDSLYVRLARDLECKDMTLNAMWDVGWRDGICMEEAEQVVVQAEEHVLSVLVEEVTMEIVDEEILSHPLGM